MRRRVFPLPIFSHIGQVFAVVVCAAVILGTALQLVTWVITGVMAWL